MAILLYVAKCEHGTDLSVIAVPCGAIFTDPACRLKAGGMRTHVADPDKYRVANDEDFFTPKVPRRTRSDKGTPRKPRAAKVAK